MGFETTVSSLGALIRVWREDAGFNLTELAERASTILPLSHSVSRATLNRYELNNFPAKGVDPLILRAIADVCGRQQSEIPEEFRGNTETLADLLRKP
jgi:transcriptional regulator with XRE-family HTH domain